MRCRKCKSVECNLSRRSSIEHLVSRILPVRPFRCAACQTRFWGLNRSSITLKHIAITLVGLLLLILLLVLSGLFTPSKRTLSVQPTTQPANNKSTTEPTDKTVAVETKKAEYPTPVLQEEDQIVLDQVGSSSLNIAQQPPTDDFISVLPKTKPNRNNKPDITPQISTTIESEPVPAKTEEINRNILSDKVVASHLPKKKPLPLGRIRLERIFLKPISGTTLVLHTNRQIEKYTFLRVVNPARIVVDLPGKWIVPKQIPLHIVVDNDLVEKIRLGRNPKNLRIVFDLGFTPVNAPIFDSKTNTLEITLSAQ